MKRNVKERIDRMSYEQMLRIKCFSPLGNPMFPEVYFNASMQRKKRRGAHTAADNLMEWDE